MQTEPARESPRGALGRGSPSTLGVLRWIGRSPVAGYAAICLGAGCVSLPRPQVAVDAIRIEGNDAISAADIEDQLATRASPRFLGLLPGVIYDYSVYNRYVFAQDLLRIERYYRARGFYAAHVRAARVEPRGSDHTTLVIAVEEGPPVSVASVTVNGLEALPEKVRKAANAAVAHQVRVGQRFEEDPFSRAQAAVERVLFDHGYAYATVTRHARVDLPHEQAQLTFDVHADKPAVFGPLQVTGLGGLPVAPVERALDLRPGEPYSLDAVERARQAALELGVFAALDVTPELSQPPPSPREVPVTVAAQPAQLRTTTLGGGMRLDAVRTDVHLTAGWEDRNFLGGLRRLYIEARPGLVLYPTRLPNLSVPQRLLPELALSGELRQPGFLEARTNGLLNLKFDVYAVLFANLPNNAAVPGYREATLSAGVERTFGRALYLRATHNLQLNTPFSYVGVIDDSLNTSLLFSYPELLAALDLRDDRVAPRQGAYLGVDLQSAGLGGDARDFRVQADARSYLPLSRRVVLALRATLGLLFPFNYDQPDINADRNVYVRDTELSFFRGFFSGGPSSNRGYPPRGVGPQGIPPFFYPNQNVPPGSVALPLGGLSLWEASAELRFGISGSFAGALFCDSSDVSGSPLSFDFLRPHLSCGPGVRYATPVGALRADLGFRIPGLQVGDGTLESGLPTLLGLPATFSVAIGETF